MNCSIIYFTTFSISFIVCCSSHFLSFIFCCQSQFFLPHKVSYAWCIGDYVKLNSSIYILHILTAVLNTSSMYKYVIPSQYIDLNLYVCLLISCTNHRCLKYCLLDIVLKFTFDACQNRPYETLEYIQYLSNRGLYQFSSVLLSISYTTSTYLNW